ncbi:AtpZ/AtpI family protein [Telluribacter humicola]|uniref:AtpZ/AtpI family protein n=1 Tax=Telluribacter humicola TaxID=1720261 RepID=UPI001A96CD5E|nr:AtpZ/AtpI family protein [Telluribacter humicola]
MSDPKQENWDKTRQRTNYYARYSSLAFQMLGTILLFTYAGYKLDEWQQNKVPVWTLILSLLSIGGSLYMFIRGLPKN